MIHHHPRRPRDSQLQAVLAHQRAGGLESTRDGAVIAIEGAQAIAGQGGHGVLVLQQQPALAREVLERVGELEGDRHAGRGWRRTVARPAQRVDRHQPVAGSDRRQLVLAVGIQRHEMEIMLPGLVP